MARALEGRVAVITGASRSIGQAIAVRFAAERAKVALIGRDEATRRKDLTGTLEEGLARIEDVGGTAIAVRADLGDVSYDKANVADQVVSALGPSPVSSDAARYAGMGGACSYGGTKAFLDRVRTGACGTTKCDPVDVI